MLSSSPRLDPKNFLSLSLPGAYNGFGSSGTVKQRQFHTQKRYPYRDNSPTTFFFNDYLGKIQGTRVDDSWLMRLQPISVFVVITTVCSGLMIVDLYTYANSVLATSSVPALIDDVDRPCDVAERSWHVHTQVKCNRILVILGTSPRFADPFQVRIMDMVHLAHYNSDNCVPKGVTHKMTTVRRYQVTRVDDSWLTPLQPIAMCVVITICTLFWVVSL